MHSLAQTLRALACACACSLVLCVGAQTVPEPLPAAASAPAPVSASPAVRAPGAEQLQVSDAYLELHTGPGRGYPVFFVVERHQWITVELRRTDWYRVRAEGGQVGWVPRQQLQTTLTEGGASKTLRELVLDDYLARRLEFGAAWGSFNDEPMLKLWTQYRLADTVGAELSLGQVQGVFSGTDFWAMSLTSEPWSDRRLSPFFSVGLGKFRNIPNRSLVSAAPTDAKLAHATLGLRWYLAERFVARVDGTLYTAFVADNRSIEYRAYTAGIAFFF
jgi:hypothetical protein